jgi:uncharacterized protein
MALKMQGSLVVDSPREQVWDKLFDIQFLQSVLNKIPGIKAENLTQVTPDRYEGTVSMGVAMVKGKYTGAITVLEKRPLEFVKFHGEGNGRGDWTSGDMALTLIDQNGKTLMTYEGTGNVSGKLASVGQRLIDTVGKHFIQYGTKAFAAALAAPSNVTAPAGEPTSR